MAGSRQLVSGPHLTMVLKRVVPLSVRRWVRHQQRRLQHLVLPARRVREFGRLRRVTPISRHFGWDRGLPIDRYYIERFLANHAGEIRGRVLEVQTSVYTRKFGGAGVTRSDVLDMDPQNPEATVVADLTRGDPIAADTYDCIICTQTLLLIYDVRTAIRTLCRILKPGGVLLVTVPGVSHQITRTRSAPAGDYWRFTSMSVRRLFEEVFSPTNVRVGAYGNVLAAIAFLHGLAAQELTREELDHNDPEYEVSVWARALKPRPTS